MKTVTVVIETPKGSAEKYDYNAEKHWFELKKIMPAGMVFPYDFGFVPDTKGEDGDPLDVIVISEFHSFPGCVMKCRIIGCIEAKQTEKDKTIRNDRFLAIPEVSQLFSHVKSMNDLPRDVIEQIEDFFINYNKISKKQFKPLKKVSASKALKLIKN